MRFIGGAFLFLIVFRSANSDEDEDIKHMWSEDVLRLCATPFKHLSFGQLSSFQFWRNADVVQAEIRSLAPLLVRFRKFANAAITGNLVGLADQQELESMNVTTGNTSYRHKGRRADGLWLAHDSPATSEIFKKLERIFRLDPRTAESFLLLKYNKNGHYAPHYDHLDENDSPDWWMMNRGNRLATMLLIAKTADEGGGTVFPSLGVTVQPEEGDLIVWFNANSRQVREHHALHGACPIKSGTKVALSLWIRSFPHSKLKSPLEGEPESHNIDHILQL